MALAEEALMTMEIQKPLPNEHRINYVSAAILLVAIVAICVGLIGLAKDTAPVWTLIFPTFAGALALANIRT